MFMEEEEEDDDEYYYPRSPFWLPSSSDLRRADLYRRYLSSFLFSLGSFVLLLLIAAILFFFFVISSFITHYTQNFKPNFVKRNWDKVNLVLALFALSFGFLSKLRYQDGDHDENQRTSSSSSNRAPNSDPRQPSPAPPRFSPMPPQKPVTLAPPAAKERTRRTHQGLERDQEQSDPPSSKAAVVQEMDQRRGRKDRKRSGRKANEKFMASFPSSSTPPPPPPPPPILYYSTYTTKKEKNHTNIPPTTPATHSFPSPPPPPPPPPTLSDYYSISKQNKRKKIPPTKPATAPPPPPPPPPPLDPTASTSRPTIMRVPFTTRKPPMPEKIHNIDDWSSGSEFHPPSPPLPPFKMRDLKYLVKDDYAKLLSTDSSHSGSSDTDEVESDETLSNEPSSPFFCPSPDADTKADSFIAKVRADIKLEKVNSYNKKKALKKSNLGPNGSPS